MPFKQTFAEIIGGTQEGVYAWVAANAAMHNFDNAGVRYETQGIIELGGASIQMVFKPLEIPVEHGVIVELGGKKHNIYSYSYDGLGIDAARKAMKDDENCNLKGFDGKTTFADYDACKQAILDVFSEWVGHPMSHLHCGLNMVYQPPVYGEFFALAGFVSSALDFVLAPFSPVSIDTIGRHYCSNSWDEILSANDGRKNPAKTKYLSNVCFDIAYISAILSGDGEDTPYNGFGFVANTENIYATRTIGDQSLSWTKGAAIVELEKA